MAIVEQYPLRRAEGEPAWVELNVVRVRHVRRIQVLERDGFRCVYCGGVFPADELTVDHVQPRVRGGDRSGGNLVTACGGCNVRKGHRGVGVFLRDDAVARANFLRYARHVWPRILRSMTEELSDEQH